MSTTRPDIDVHPKTHLPSSITQTKWNVIVIGGGPAGQAAAIKCATGGLSVLIVESELTGGECQNWACVPSKALLRPLEVAADAASVGGTREKLRSCAEARGTAGNVNVDLQGLFEYRDKCAVNWNDGPGIAALGGLGVSITHGFALVVGKGKVQIKDWHSGGSVLVEAVAVVVATGSEPFIPDIEGLRESGYWTPREAVSANEVPDHLIILGAGLVGTEMATVYGQLGSRVTLITRQKRILPKVVEYAAELVANSLRQTGVDIRVETHVRKVKRRNGLVEAELADSSDLTGREILIATGRRARTAGMGLTTVKGLTEGAHIDVDESMCAVTVPEGWLYAIGDTNGLAWTTHMGMYQAVICANTILAKARGSYQHQLDNGNDLRISRRHSATATPQTCFTDPQVSWVGLSLKDTKRMNINAREVSVDTGGPGTHSYLHSEGYTGWAQWVIETGTGRLLGAVFVGRGVANLLHASSVAIVGGLTWRQLFHAVPSFPTLSEVYQLLVEKCAAMGGEVV
ncbi:hypothetical protein OHC33_005560 [Knufia fluminis]|uniref:Uncharacterized protein n=1 Tax=Knufia fluminis TaxID=191047 RepID=A0AAN8I7Q2_9EURO|nr:hypothetical protein OHC33_005560 [Knufia fluminis]